MRGKQLCLSPAQEHCRITPAGAGKTLTYDKRYSVSWDHPRRCGENLLESQRIRQSRGSPPQVRGKRRRRTKWLNTNRITPAGAGKTEGADLTAARAEDHPRRCGENWTSRDLSEYIVGSPPQVRGKHCFSQRWENNKGITPAGAGKTYTYPPRQ